MGNATTAELAAACEVELPAAVVVAAASRNEGIDGIRAIRAGHYGGAVPILAVPPFDTSLEWLDAGASAIAARDDAAAIHAFLTSLVRTGQAVRALFRRASIDSLTGAATRGVFLDLLAKAIARAQRHDLRLSVAVIDVDGLKRVNDAGGHAAGDAVLRGVAAAAGATIRTSDGFGRLGGDEFGWILDGTDPEQADEAIARFRKALAEGGTGSVSVGVATFTPPQTPLALIALADQDLYRRRARRT